MGHWLANPRRRAFGGVSVGAGIGWQFTALYNDSVGPDLLVPYYFALHQISSPLIDIYLVQGTIGTFVSQGVPCFAGEAATPGQIWNGFLASRPASAQSGQLSADSASFSLIPSIILQPGWSLALGANATVNTAIATAGFFWACVHAEDIDGSPCAICDMPTPLQ